MNDFMPVTGDSTYCNPVPFSDGKIHTNPDPFVEQTRKILGDAVQPVTEELYDTEFNDYKITVKVVASLDEAMAHIAKYSTKHSECIITRDLDAAQKFQRTVDAAVVYVNASTRFTDGGEFGYGAEIGISTQKLHARGPMGLHELTTVKYLVSGNGQIRE